jgi:hypothetical protein
MSPVTAIHNVNILEKNRKIIVGYTIICLNLGHDFEILQQL